MVFDKVKEIIVETISCDEDKVILEARLTEDLEADSLDAVELIMALEEAFGIHISDEELSELKTVEDIVKSIEQKQE
ncbi:MAG: acyl carrier protein [Anaerovoracaceae bacterium]